MFLRIMLVGWAVIPKYVVGRTVTSSKYTLTKLYKWTNWRNCVKQSVHALRSEPHWSPLASIELQWHSWTSTKPHWLKWPPEISTDPNDPNWVLFSPMKPPLKLIDPPLSCRDPLLTHNDTCLSKMNPMWLQIILINSRFSFNCFEERQPKQFHQLPSSSAVFPSKGNQSCHMILSLT